MRAQNDCKELTLRRLLSTEGKKPRGESQLPKEERKKKKTLRVCSTFPLQVLCVSVCVLSRLLLPFIHPSFHPFLHSSIRQEGWRTLTTRQSGCLKKKEKGKVRDRTEGITYCAENTDKPASVLLVLPISRKKLQNAFWSFCVLFFLTLCTEETLQHSFSASFTPFLSLPW